MDPRGQIQDLQTLRKLGENIEPCLSPEVCFDLVKDLNATKGKGWVKLYFILFYDNDGWKINRYFRCCIVR